MKLLHDQNSSIRKANRHRDNKINSIFVGFFHIISDLGDGAKRCWKEDFPWLRDGAQGHLGRLDFHKSMSPASTCSCAEEQVDTTARPLTISSERSQG